MLLLTQESYSKTDFAIAALSVKWFLYPPYKGGFISFVDACVIPRNIDLGS